MKLTNFCFSDDNDDILILSQRLNVSRGPWCQCIDTVKRFQLMMNTKITNFNAKFSKSVELICFSNIESFNFNADIYKTIRSLNLVEHEIATDSSMEINDCVKLRELLLTDSISFGSEIEKLQIHLLNSAFINHNTGEYFVDLVKNNDGKFRSVEEYTKLFNNKSFLAYFYKVPFSYSIFNMLTLF